jgi:iron complex transport system substrate-binding protein
MGETAVAGAPERVVTLTQGSTEALLALGLAPVGAVQGWGADPWYPHWEERLTDTQVVGGETQPNIEAIASLRPDLIIGSTIRHDEALYEQLSLIAPTVFTETIGESWRENLPLIAEAVGRTDDGERVIGAYESRVAEIRAALQDAGHTDTTVSLVRFNPGQVRLYDGYPGAIIRDVGLSLPEAQQEVLEGQQIVTFTSRERIPLLDADVMFFWSTDWWDPGKAAETRNEWTGTELWQSLGVVEAGEVHEVSAVSWNLAGGVLAAHRVLDDIEATFGLAD